MGKWEDGNFPDADDPNNVSYMIVHWKVIKKSDCEHCERDNYGLVSTQPDHLPLGSNLGDAQALFQKYVSMHRGRGKRINRKKHSIFLVKVEQMTEITDNKGEPKNGS